MGSVVFLASQALGDAKEDLELTRKQRAADVEFLRNLRLTCQARPAAAAAAAAAVVAAAAAAAAVVVVAAAAVVELRIS